MPGFFSTLPYEAWPGKPRWTPENMPDLAGKITVVTGGNTGIGWETCKALLEHNAKVYLCARSEEKANAAIEKLKQVTGKDNVHFLKLDLGDLPSAAAAARELAAKEPKIDILFLNAGVMIPPADAKTAQGYELQWGTNVVGHFVFTKLLLPNIVAAAKYGAPNAARVVWTSSNGHNFAPKGWINFADVNLPKGSGWARYGQSKAGNILLATYIARHYAEDGVLAFSLNPGGIRSELQRHSGWFGQLLAAWLLFPTPMGAINQLYAGTSPELTTKDSGKYFIPWARAHPTNSHLNENIELADKLWDFLEKDTAGKY